MSDSQLKDDFNTDRIDGRKTMASKFGSTVGASFYTERGSDIIYGEEPIEKNKKRILKKTIASVPSLDKDVRNVLTMALQRGPRAFNEELQGRQLEKAEELRDKLMKEARKFMDTENAEELKDLLHRVIIMKDSSYETVLKALKLYLVSSVERNYVERIDEEISKGLALDNQIKEMNEILGEEKEKKRRTIPVQDNIETQLKQIQQYENKIEKANQKLNDKIAKTNDIREKINKLRKDALVLNQVHQDLEQELKDKQERVEQTIKEAGYAYIKRNEAEGELKDLKKKAVESKKAFGEEMELIKEEIREVEKFKEFINGKEKEKKELENLKAAIAKNKKKIEEKEKANAMMEKEYSLSAKKEEEIKNAFERIMEKTGIKKPEDLLIVFNTLYEKNQNMEKFVKELNLEIESLDSQINQVKMQLQHYSVKGATKNNKNRQEKTDIIKKLQDEDKKKKLYKSHYEKLIKTLETLKDIIEKVFVSIGADEEMITRIRNSATTEDNMTEFIGILEQKGINLLGEYARLLAEQIKLERGDIAGNPNLIEDLNNLNNIVAYENANVLLMKANSPQQAKEFPDDMMFLDPTDKETNNHKETILSPEQIQQLALSFLNNKQVISQPAPKTFGIHKGSRINRLNYANKVGKKLA